MKVVLNTVFVILFSVTCLKAQDQSIPYTQADRDRMVRMETQIESIQPQIIPLVHPK